MQGVDEEESKEIQNQLDDGFEECSLQGANSENSEEWADHVMMLPNNEENSIKVIDSKTIWYFSNFDININEWFNEYENIEIFKLNMKKNLGIFYRVWMKLCIGSMWLKYFNEAVVYDGKAQLQDDFLFSLVFNFYLVNYYSETITSLEAFKILHHTEQVKLCHLFTHSVDLRNLL